MRSDTKDPKKARPSTAKQQQTANSLMKESDYEGQSSNSKDPKKNQKINNLVQDTLENSGKDDDDDDEDNGGVVGHDVEEEDDEAYIPVQNKGR